MKNFDHHFRYYHKDENLDSGAHFIEQISQDILELEELCLSLSIPIDSATWTFQVSSIRWDGHTPYTLWHTFKVWEQHPTDEQLALAKEEALADTRYFRTCTKCTKLHNIGHMHNASTCQSCSGVIH